MVTLAFGVGLMSVYGFFVEPLTLEFGVSTAVINLGPVLLLLVPALVSPFVGRLADNIPIKRLVFAGIVIAATSLVAITQMPTLTLVALCFMFFSLGLTCYGPVVVSGLMVKLYPGREARALAIVAMGTSVAAVTLPLLAGWLLSHLSWRVSLACFAALVLVVVGAAAAVGLPSGIISHARRSTPVSGRAMLRRKEFWLIGLCVAAGLGTSIIMTIVYPPLFLARDYSLKEAGGFLALAGVFGASGKVGIAWFGDSVRDRAKWLAVTLLALQVVGFSLLIHFDTTVSVVSALAFLGFGTGAFIPLHPYLNSRFFESDVISQVIGAQTPIFLPFVLVGAPLAGFIFDTTGSYDALLYGLMGLLVFAMLLAAALPGRRS